MLAASVAVLAMYYPTLRAMAEIWARSGSFTHGFLVLPIAGWLLFRHRHAINATTPRVYYPGFVVLALLAVAWYLAYGIRADVAAQGAMMLMIPALVLAVLGPEVLRATLFPLGFALLAVPAGEFLTPALMDITASGSVALLVLSGVPVYRDGWLISIPEGNFHVAEACSGIRYLVAALTTAILFAWFFFRTAKKRIIFIVFTAIFTVLANVARAYIIIMLARLSDMRLAVGVDHFIYGWFLFSILLVVVFLVGLKYADAMTAAPGEPIATTFRRRIFADTARFGAAAGGAFLLIVAAPVAASRMHLAGPAAGAPWLPAVIAGRDIGPIADAPEWLRSAPGLDANLVGYGTGGEGLELLVLRARDSATDVGGLRDYLAEEGVTLVSDDREPDADFRRMQLDVGSRRLLIGYWFTVAGQQTANPVTAKLREAITILSGEHQRPALIAVALETNKLDQPVAMFRRLVTAAMDAVSACPMTEKADPAPGASSDRCRRPAAAQTG